MLLGGFSLALALLAVVAGLNWRHTNHMRETEELVARTHEVQASLSRLLKLLVDIETGHRGFVITGDPKFLDPLDAALKGVGEQALQLRRQFLDVRQKAGLAALEPLIAGRIAQARDGVALRQRSGFEAAREEVAAGKGKALMDQIRDRVAELDAREETLLEERTAAARRESDVTRLVSIVGNGLSVGLFIAVFGLVLRETRLRVRANLALRASEEHLAVTLDSIGDAVLATDAAGLVTRMNPIAERLTGWTQAGALGHPVAEVFHILSERTGQPAVIPVDKVLATGEIHGLANHTILVARDGTARPIADSAAPIRAKEGRILGVVLVFRDVTEEKTAERALRDSEERYRTLFDSIDEGYCVVEVMFDGQEQPVDYRFLQTNPAFERQSGLRDALGRRMRELAPAHEAVWFETYGRVAMTGQPTRFQHRAEALHRWFDVYAFRFGAPENRQVAVLFSDITEQRRAEERLRDSESLNRAVIDSVMAHIAVVDRHGTIIAINKGWERFARENSSGPSSPTVGVGVNYLEVCGRAAPGAGSEAWEILRGIESVLARSEATFNCEYACHSPTEQRWFNVLVSRLARAEGGAVIAHINITDRKRAEEQIRNFNRTLEETVVQRTSEVRQALATLDATVDGAYIFDPTSLRFTYANKGAKRQLGYSREELLKLTPLDLNTQHDEPAFRMAIAPLVRGEKSVLTIESVFHRKDGTTLPVELNLQYIAPADASPRFIAIVRDISERKQAEQQARRSQRLEAIGTLAGGIAHDLNNALAPIMMSGELLRMKYPAEPETLDLIAASTQRATDMVRQLLSFARGAEGQRAPVEPGRLVKEMRKIMEGTFPKNIQLVVKCDPTLPPAMGDATQLHQVLLNLCVNARDAMPHGGTLTLEARPAVVDATHARALHDAKPGNYLTLRVSDTGTGIPPELIDRIFDPFFTTKSRDKGTGLGLSTVMGIIRGHGGFVQVHSQPGEGSSFTVYLPTDHTTGDTELAAKEPVEFHGQGETILFVDDEAALRKVGRVVLQRLNFTPLTATDGADGLIQAAQHRTEIRAVITDLHMPYMDGLAFVQALRRMLPDVPILVASGGVEDANAEDFKTLGVTRFLDKPFTEAQLAEALRTIFKP